jgi:hypothetical protein
VGYWSVDPVAVASSAVLITHVPAPTTNELFELDIDSQNHISFKSVATKNYLALTSSADNTLGASKIPEKFQFGVRVSTPLPLLRRFSLLSFSPPHLPGYSQDL